MEAKNAEKFREYPEESPTSSLGRSTHTRRVIRDGKKVRAESASTSSRGFTFNLGAGWLQRQHSKEHSRVIKRGKWSPGGEARLFEAVSSKGNLAMTSAEPRLHSAAGGASDRERPGGEGNRGTILYSHNRLSLSLSALGYVYTRVYTCNTPRQSRGERAHLWPPADLRAVAGLSAGNLLL